STEAFNGFIDHSELIDIPMGGKKFSRVNRLGNKMSRLDRFLVTEVVVDRSPYLTCMTLERKYSDHCQLLLKEERNDYGPNSFKIFNSWMEMDGFDKMSKKKWIKEGDDNTKLFHGMLKRKRSQENITVWACGSDKAPGPDEFSFRFLRRFWDDFQTEVVEFVHEFSDLEVITQGCNVSFITLIPKCENPTLIKDFRPISLIGLQYKIIAKLLADSLVKVVDSIVSPEQSAFIKGRQITDGALMNYSDCMFEYMGFGDTWRKWIRGCLVSTRASVLLNGSPTKEFQLHSGLRQGDPLYPFLFILAIEGLHILIEDAVQYSRFKGVQVRSSSIIMSHLFYADDSIFMGEWDRDNVECLIRILNIFYLASRLQLNLQKSKLYRLGVVENDVQDLARCTGYGADSIPFMYLRLLVGERMYRANSWTPLMAKFKKRLANWKSKLMSISGRLTLVKSVLGINQALLFKWHWRFLNGNDMPWVKLIKSCHDTEGGFLDGGTTPPKSGVWASIVRACMELHTHGLVPNSAIRRKVSNCRNTRFWKDMWCGDGMLEATYPRLATLALIGMLLLAIIGPCTGGILVGGEISWVGLNKLNMIN
ncbi:RNA-directed DNA polymerase, eukaryota, reverse transcriptase zinc-binding domain protein, partial [Tanacetum coccineum]